MHLLQYFHPDDICPRCEVLTTPRSHHCSICDRCVERWDHHCPWIDNCVGIRNHNYFFLHLISATLLFAVLLVPPFREFIHDKNHKFSWESEGKEEEVFKNFCVKCDKKEYVYTVFALQCLIAFVGFIFLLWISFQSFRKFARDGAQLAEEEDGNQIGFDDDR